MYDDIPNFLREFLLYMQNIKNRSQSTIREYHYDLRDTFRFLKLFKVDKLKLTAITNELMEQREFSDLDLQFVRQIELTDLYEYLNYLSNVR